MPCQLRIGLTGGIGSGKSTVAGLFEALGVPVIDADRVAREVVEPGEPALEEVVAAFGPQVLQVDGTLDRRSLRDRVFADPRARARLEAILHPRIRAIMEARAGALSAPYCVLCVPLLVEAGQLDLVDRVLVVDAAEALQVERVCRRDGVSRDTALAMLRAQAPRAARLAVADDVVTNDGDLLALRRELERLHERYLRLAEGGLRPAGG
jgi:dephospho-CoA kinase